MNSCRSGNGLCDLMLERGLEMLFGCVPRSFTYLTGCAVCLLLMEISADVHRSGADTADTAEFLPQHRPTSGMRSNISTKLAPLFRSSISSYG
jgi:hypothetical protein